MNVKICAPSARALKPRWLRLTWLLPAMACALPAMAQWTGKGEAGVAIASGNTDTKSANARVAVGYKSDAWEDSATLAGNYVRTDGLTTARRWELGAQTRYNFGAHTFWFGAGRYEQDRFSGFDHQGVISTGVGRKFIDSDTTHLAGQVGVGFKFFETIATLAAPASKETELGGVASLNFDHQLTKTTTVYDKFGAEFTSDNNFLQNELGLTVKMTDRLALSLAYAVRHNTDPPVGFKKTDTLSTLNLVYEVK
jgi:putative salt-induced outer membrane protein